MKIAIFLFAVMLSLSCFSQKIKLKDGIVSVDAVDWLKYQNCGTSDKLCSVLNMNNIEVVVIKKVQADGLITATENNPKGADTYYEVKFPGVNQVFESNVSIKRILAMLYESKAITETGEPDANNIQLLVQKHGREYSTKPKAASENTIEKKKHIRPSGNIN